LRTIKDRLKLKKTPIKEKQSTEKEVKVVTEKVDEQKSEASPDVDMKNENFEEVKSVEIISEKPDTEMVKEEERHIMFVSDKIEESFKQIVWFGKKVPMKRKMGMRSLRGGVQEEDVLGP
jgi:ABC-type Fe3+/spermidine/putrescine transport system ATPase subunit